MDKEELIDGKFYKCKMFSEDAQTFVLADVMYRKDIAWSGMVKPILKDGKPVEVKID